MSQNLLLGDAAEIVAECSDRHIQSVIEDMQEQLKIAAELRKQVMSLNPNWPEIGLGRLAQMQAIANRMSKVGN